MNALAQNESYLRGPLLQKLVPYNPRQSGAGWKIVCPAHSGDGKDRNLYVGIENGKVILRCWSRECTYEAIKKALGLWEERAPVGAVASPNIISYQTFDRAGRLVATQTRRITPEGKECRWQRNGKPGLDGMKVNELPLYGSQFIDKFDASLPVDIGEGQPATEALRSVMAQALGTYGTGNEPSKEVLSWVKDKTLRLWPDNDPADSKGIIKGVAHMRAIARAAMEAGAAKVIILDTRSLPPKGDAVEWLQEQLFERGVDKQELIEKMKSEEVPGLPALEVFTRPAPRMARPIKDFLAIKVTPREELCGPWLKAGTTTEVYGWRGAGKSWFCMWLAYCVSTGRSFMKWECKAPRRVVYVDGEMSLDDTQERLSKIIKAEEKRAGRELESKLCYLSDSDVEQFPDGLPKLSTPEGRELIESQLSEGPALIVLDNLSTLFNSAIENDAESWVEVQDWLLSLRRRGHTILFVHHAGKGGQQRGTSKREDICNNVIALKQPEDHRAEDGAAFLLKFEKSRGVHGPDVASFEAKLTTDEDGDLTWAISAAAQPSKADIIATLREEGYTAAQIAKMPGFTRSQVYKVFATPKVSPVGSSGGLSSVLSPRRGERGQSDQPPRQHQEDTGQSRGQPEDNEQGKPHHQKKISFAVRGQDRGQSQDEKKNPLSSPPSENLSYRTEGRGQPRGQDAGPRGQDRGHLNDLDPITEQIPEEKEVDQRPQDPSSEGRSIAEETRPTLSGRKPWEVEQLTNIVAGYIEGGTDPYQAWARVLQSDQLAQDSEAF